MNKKIKIYYFCLLVMSIVYSFLTKEQLLLIVAPISAFFVTIDLISCRFSSCNILFNRVLKIPLIETGSNNYLTNIGLVSLFILAMIIFFPKVIIINAFTILVVSNSLSIFVGSKIESEAFFEKSLIESIVFSLASIAVVTFYGIFFDQSILYYLFAIFAIFATTIVNARPSLFKINNDIAIPLTFCIVMFLFNLIWIYN